MMSSKRLVRRQVTPKGSCGELVVCGAPVKSRNGYCAASRRMHTQ
jgi:hypothetical protein